MKLEELAAHELRKQLTASEIQSDVQHNQVFFHQWPTLGIKILPVNPTHTAQTATVLQFQIQTQLNVDHPDSTLQSYCVGIGSDLEHAVQSGIDIWMRLDFPPIFSLLNGQPMYGAEWFPNGDPFGVPGWDMFSSPYVIRGASPGTETLNLFLQEHPLLDPIRQDIPQFLDRQNPLNLVSIYKGISEGKRFADCRIHGKLIRILSDTLLMSDWPSEIIPWVSVRQSLLLC